MPKNKRLNWLLIAVLVGILLLGAACGKMSPQPVEQKGKQS